MGITRDEHSTEIDGHEAAIHQSLIGPTRVTFLRDGEEIHTSEGFVA